MSWRNVRIVVTLLLGALALAWLSSLPLLERTAGQPQASIERLSTPPSWRDMLLLRLEIDGIGVQQVPISIGWSQRQPGGYAIDYGVSLYARADGQAHQYAIPVGLHPQWRGDIHNLHVITGRPTDVLNVDELQLTRRPSWALDLWLGRLLAPHLASDPPWPGLALCIAALLTLALALIWPSASWRRRVQYSLLLLGGGAGLVAMFALFSLVGASYRFYHGLDEPSAMAYVTARAASAQFDRILISNMAALPAGPILVDGLTGDDYLSMRTRYLLYPRRVDSYDLRSPAGQQQLQDASYASVIQAGAGAAPLGAGWQRVSAAGANPALWRKAGLLPAALPTAPGPGALSRLLAGLVLVLASGWVLAGRLGLRGWERLCCAWPIGVSILAWWMFALNIAGLPWSWWSIGLPLALGALLLWLASRPDLALHRGRIERLLAFRVRPSAAVWRGHWRSWQPYGLLALVALALGVTAQAVLLPFTDADTWRIWAFKGRGFYIDGGLEHALRIYRQVDLYHATYPPAQPLAQAWGYLAMGGISERLVKLIFPLWYVACLGISYGACRQWCSRAHALAWTLLLATTPIMLDHATLGNADLPLATALLFGAWALASWIDTGAGLWLAAAVLGMAGAAWIKLDGLYLGIGMIGLALILRALARRREPGAARRAILAGALALGALLAASLPWQLYALSLGLNSDIPGGSVLRSQGMAIVRQSLVVVGTELFLSNSNSSFGPLGSGYGLFWLICALAILSSWRAALHDAVSMFLLLSTLGGIACYAFMYTVAPYHSIERYLLHLAPLALLAAARSMRESALSRPPSVIGSPSQP